PGGQDRQAHVQTCDCWPTAIPKKSKRTASAPAQNAVRGGLIGHPLTPTPRGHLVEINVRAAERRIGSPSSAPATGRSSTASGGWRSRFASEHGPSARSACADGSVLSAGERRRRSMRGAWLLSLPFLSSFCSC